VRSVSSARFVTRPLTQRKRETLEYLLDRFVASVNFCIRKCLEHRVTSRASLHRVAYEEWKSKFNLATHWFHSAGRVATQTLRSWRRLCRQGRADSKRPPVYEARTMRLELWSESNASGVCRFHGHAVQIRIRRGEHLWLPLVVTEHHELRYLRDWREGKAKVGEVTISLFGSRANVFVPFKREVEPKPPEGICGVDVNERSVDLCILKPGQEPRHIKLDTSKLAAIAHSMELKQKSIQRKLDAPPLRPVQKRRLKRKYERRRRNRTNQVLHVVSKRIAEVLERERVEPVFEDPSIDALQTQVEERRGASEGHAPQAEPVAVPQAPVLRRVQGPAARVPGALPAGRGGRRDRGSRDLKHVPDVWRPQEAEWARVLVRTVRPRRRPPLRRRIQRGRALVD